MTLTREEREAGRIHRQAKNRERKEAKARRPKNMKASRGREVDHGFLAFLRRQPCCVGPLGAPARYRLATSASAFLANRRPVCKENQMTIAARPCVPATMPNSMT